MKRGLLIVALLAVVAGIIGGAVAYWLLSKPEPEWTTRSPKALASFVDGLADLAKMYQMDAVRHFEEALELDPAFAMAKLHLAVLYPSRSERRRMIGELHQIDPADLNARERFLLADQLAREDGRSGDSAAIVGSFLEQYPNDPYGIRAQCRLDWEAQQWDEAERCYSNLLVLHPNWVEARNNLGYIAMASGRFDEAEERFRTYRYLAPDQVNPNHSLAVLLTLVGRYEEAEEAIAEAIDIKPDFCAAYTQQAEIGLMSGRPDLTEATLADLESIEACDFLEERGFACGMRGWLRYLAGDAEGAWRELDGPCLEQHQGFDLLTHRIATITDRPEPAAKIEGVLNRYRDKVSAAGLPVNTRFLTALSAHMEGIRALKANDLALAVEHLTEADAMLGYWGGERASIKLFNRLNLLRVLELAGRVQQATALRREIDAVNPLLVEAFPLPDIDILQRVGVAGLPASFPLREDRHQ